MIEVWEFPAPNFNSNGGTSIVPVKTEFPEATEYRVSQQDGSLSLYKEREIRPLATFAPGVWKKVVSK